jgi:hypothetical protein
VVFTLAAGAWRDAREIGDEKGQWEAGSRLGWAVFDTVF